MTLAWLLALQTAGSPAPGGAAASDFDLARYRPAAPEPGECARGSAGEIVVCGRRLGNDYPLEKMEAKFRQKPIVAEKAIGPAATVRAYGESVGMPGGQVSKRAMVGVKVRF